jgi:Carbohydrate esterase, sialic acid-specific acetylesterase
MPNGPGNNLLRLAIAALSIASSTDARAADRPWVFLLMGQSNMSGRGRLADVPANAFPRQAAVSVYGNDGRMRAAREPVDDPMGQIDAVSVDTAAGVGPGLAFADELVRLHPGLRVVLVPCAMGGSTIRQWQRSASRTTLYGSCLARAAIARRTGKLAGILWYQGESDATRRDTALIWRSRFRAMVRDLRADLAAPGLPVVLVKLGAHPPIPVEQSTYPMWMLRSWRWVRGRPLGEIDKFPHWELVQAAQSSASAPGSAVVSAAGLPTLADGIHLNTQGQLQLGRIMARAIDPLLP